MSKPLIVIADMDTAYLAELENKFLVELGDRAELEIISDPEYFEQFFSNPVTAEIVAVKTGYSESVYFIRTSGTGQNRRIIGIKGL
mgnify:CR=1 FL=1